MNKVLPKIIFALVICACIVFYGYLVLGKDVDFVYTFSTLFTKFQGAVINLIFLVFIILVALIIATFLHYLLFELRESNVVNRTVAVSFKNGIRKYLSQARTNPSPNNSENDHLEKLKENLRKDRSLFSQLLSRIHSASFLSGETLKDEFFDLLDLELNRLRRRIAIFSFTGVVAPTLGFLGTALGMVSAFYEISLKETVSPNDLARSIQIALITTVVGLIIKVCSLLMQAYVANSIDRSENLLIETFEEDFIY